MTAAAVAAKGVVGAQPGRGGVPAAAPKSGWLASAAKMPPAAIATLRPGVQPAAAGRPLPQQTAPTATGLPVDQGPGDDGVVLMCGDIALSSEFRDWCREQLKRLQGSEDLALVEVILSMASRSEVADTCQSYLGNKTGVGAFVAEFLKRKDAELLRQAQAAKKKAKKGK